MSDKTKRTRNKYTLEDKANALRYYLLGLNFAEISKLLNVTVRTLESWQKAEKWTEQKAGKQIEKKAFEMFTDKKMKIEQIAKVLNKSIPTISRYLKKVRDEQRSIN
ncbi:ArsR family transcriptional regulator [Myroides sp. JBRI-B21084]|uniref:terminase gpP N-terminus-related DNA-binding protein n=1 Tax=Myroides sp. JBRI-B21084 TaxID=3119977 RepID=UPI0026E417F4|nr:ArsR family transcriptional regulator [Paenimyroides cloacae]WKW46728.1 ArsR family transcriptional regulator [Paenimyroides cloacae]